MGRCTAKLTVRPPAWRELRAALRHADLRAVAADYPAPPGAADLIVHVVRTRAGAVRIALPNPEHRKVARRLQPLLKDLNKLVSAGERRMPSSSC